MFVVLAASIPTLMKYVRLIAAIISAWSLSTGSFAADCKLQDPSNGQLLRNRKEVGVASE